MYWLSILSVRALFALSLLGFSLVMLGAPPSHGLARYWSCTSLSGGDRCWDAAWPYHHTWVEVHIDVGEGVNYNAVCAKARTEAGNTKRPKNGYAHCSHTNANFLTCLRGPDPTSRAYGYATGQNQPIDIFDSAATPTDSFCG